jgi:hypothetical protein
MPLDVFRARPKQAGVAQLVEQRIRNAKVVGSTPISGTKLFFPTPSVTTTRGLHAPLGFLYVFCAMHEKSSWAARVMHMSK